MKTMEAAYNVVNRGSSFSSNITTRESRLTAVTMPPRQPSTTPSGQVLLYALEALFVITPCRRPSEITYNEPPNHKRRSDAARCDADARGASVYTVVALLAAQTSAAATTDIVATADATMMLISPSPLR